ncbi:MAG TPA: gamma carbonic anhydrase family protein [Polyangiales bacterium]|nr:gamma carbonic anhydrase family protein [Polyangiales bacterium]
MLYRLGDRVPSVHPSAFVAPSAQLIGAVLMHEDSSVWFNVVVRGDNELMTIGAGTNVQDLSMLHTDAGIPLTIGRGCTVGHKVTLHGCVIGDHTLIGMDSVVLNRARIGSYCLIGANTLVTEGKQIPDGSVVMGSPGKIVRQVTDAERLVLEGSALHYVENARRFREQLSVLG